MLKVMTLVGTRPELIKMSRVIAEMDRQVNHVLVHSGQNYDYELNQVFFDDLEIRKPDHFLGAAGETAAQTIAEVIQDGQAHAAGDVAADESGAAEYRDELGLGHDVALLARGCVA